MAHSVRCVALWFLGLALLVPGVGAAEPNTGKTPETRDCAGVPRTCGAWEAKGPNTCRSCQQAQCKTENGQEVVAGNKTQTECYEGHGAPPAAGVMRPPRRDSRETKQGAKPQAVEGAVVEGDQIRALPGYTLEPGPKNEVVIKRIGGRPGGLGHTFPGCGCKGGSGTCTIETNEGGTGGSCGKRATDTCTGQCGFSTPDVGGGGGGLRAQ
jgi:hypothetical protein